MMTTFEPVIYL